MMIPDITDLIGKPSDEVAGPLNLPCLWVVEEVYRRMGLEINLVDLDEGETEWARVDLDDVPVGATLGMEGLVPGFVGHFAIHLGWGLCLHASPKQIEVVPIASLVRKIIEAHIPCSLL